MSEDGGNVYIDSSLTPLLTPCAECFPGAGRGHVQEVTNDWKSPRSRRKGGSGDATRQTSGDDVSDRDGGKAQRWAVGNHIGRLGKKVHE